MSPQCKKVLSEVKTKHVVIGWLWLLHGGFGSRTLHNCPSAWKPQFGHLNLVASDMLSQIVQLLTALQGRDVFLAETLPLQL